ncbi:DUF4244 domain-containing protein [Streptomyces sp. NPDC059255]|uniref:DUF4244 domain-containing protein n=1 Tax=Streptomyces sp. NPDC059255 TaxID=3346793 RepID=UPI0036A291C9
MWTRQTRETRETRPVRRRGGLLRVLRRRTRADTGMTTSEYAVGTIAACAFAAVLYRVVTSGSVSGALEGLIGRALGAQF